MFYIVIYKLKIKNLIGKYFPTVIDKSAKNQERIIFSGGKIGYQIDTTLEELAKVINYTLEDITKDKI